ncbi:MAG: hypothetical protein RIT45_2499 [Pseudomonadota bacterium]
MRRRAEGSGARQGAAAKRLGWIAAIALATASLPACETQQPYAACDLDEEVTKTGVCSGDGSLGTGTTSCVVTKHPHCTDGICLSYFGNGSVCSSPCTEDAECGDGFCWAFDKDSNERYCVPNSQKQ